MTLIKRDNTRNTPSHRLVNDFFNDSFFNWMPEEMRQHRALPPVNLVENNDGWTIELAVPGFKKEDFNIELEENKLSISAEVEESKTDENANYSKREFIASSFKRVFQLPEDKIKAEEIEASYEQGVLSLTLPKKEEAKPQPMKKIAIK